MGFDPFTDSQRCLFFVIGRHVRKKGEIMLSTNVCKVPDKYFKTLTEKEMCISWTCHLNNGEKIFGDYDREGYEKCWDRLKLYCKINKLHINKISLYMFGQPQFVFWEDDSGLDGVSICRGVARDQTTPDNFKDFQFLSVSKMGDKCDYIAVKKFVWPAGNEIEPLEEKRVLTQNNVQELIFKYDSEKRQHPEVQKYLNGAGL